MHSTPESVASLQPSATHGSAHIQQLRSATQHPRLLAAGAALVENRIAVAETLLREHLKQSPTDIAAIRMLAEVAGRLGRYSDSETLLARCLELAPDFTAAIGTGGGVSPPDSPV